MALDKINFQNGTIVRSNFLNEIQKGTTFLGANRADYFGDPTTSEENSWKIGQRDGLKDWELDPRFGIGSVAASGRINKWQAIPNTDPVRYTSVPGLPSLLFVDPDTGTAVNNPFISINSGSFIDQNGEKREWSTQKLQIDNNKTNYIFYKYNSSTSTWSFVYNNTGFPSSEVLHLPIAKITITNGSIPLNSSGSIFHTGGFVDYRQGSYSGYLNSYSSQLVNTDIKISDYQAKPLDRVLCNTSAGSFIVTLPANPEDGSRVAIVDINGDFDRFPIVIKAYEGTTGGITTPAYTINGSSDNWIINTKNSYISLFYSELTADWRFEDLPLDSGARLGEFISCGGRELLPNITETVCITGNPIPAVFPDPSLGTYYWDAAQGACYAQVSTTTALYGDGTTSGTIKEFNSRRCGTEEDISALNNANKRNIIFVDPIVGDDSIINSGASDAPFRTIERALLEGVRRSYRTGSENDIIDSISIQLAPGDYYVDNNPGSNNLNDITTIPVTNDGYIARETITGTKITTAYNSTLGYFIAELPASSANSLKDFKIQLGRVIYSSSGGVGTITRLRQVSANSISWRVYIEGVSGTFALDDILEYDDLSKFNPQSGGGLVVPRGISINGMDLRKVKIRPMYVPLVSSGEETAIFKVTGNTYISQLTFADNRQFNYSHSKVTSIEYASKCELSGEGAKQPDGTIPSCSGVSYYEKINKAFSTIDSYSTSSPEGRNDEWSIVTRTFLNRSERYSDSEINLTGEDRIYDGITSTDGLDVNDSTILTTERVPGPAISTNSAFTSNIGLPDINSTRSSSPYVFNCSVRSIYGMNGMHANGSKVEGLRSMVVAQFTQVSLQVDPSAFDNGYTPSTPSADRQKAFKNAYRHFGFKASNDSYIQIVSCFVIGNADHFVSESGGDLSITNSCSDFGDIALKAIGYKTAAFSQDIREGDPDNSADTGTHISEIIPPKPLSGTFISSPSSTEAGNVSTGLTIDRTLTASSIGRIYLSASYNDKSKPPSASIISGGGRYSYTKGSGTGIVLSGPTEYQKIFIKGKGAPNNSNSQVSTVSATSSTLISGGYSTNFMGFVRTVASNSSNDQNSFEINSVIGVDTSCSVYAINNSTVYKIPISGVNTTTNVITLNSNLPSTPVSTSDVFIYRDDRTTAGFPEEECIRTVSSVVSSSNSINLSDIRGINKGDYVFGPGISGKRTVSSISQSTGNTGTITISGNAVSIDDGKEIFVGVRQDTSSIPITIKVTDTNTIDGNVTGTDVGVFDIMVNISKLGDRENFIIDSVEKITSGNGFKVSTFNVSLNTSGSPLNNYPFSAIGDGSTGDKTNYTFNSSNAASGFIGSPGFFDNLTISANVTLDQGSDIIYSANLLPPTNSQGATYTDSAPFTGSDAATLPDEKSRVFSWDETNNRWYFRVEEYVANSSNTNTIYKAILDANNQGTTVSSVRPRIANFSPIAIRRNIDRRSADQRLYRVKVKNFNGSVRKPLVGYIVQAQGNDWDPADTSKAFVIANVQDQNESGTILNNAENVLKGLATINEGEYILTLLKLEDANKVISKGYYPDIDYDDPTADPADSLTRSAMTQFIGFNIRKTDQTTITLGAATDSFAIRRYFAPSTYNKVYCELRRPSLIRATNHTWEWVGYLNYDTALPSLQGDAFSLEDKEKKILTEVNGGRIYATGMDEDGIFRIGSFSFDLKINKQYDTSIPNNPIETSGGGAGRLTVQLGDVVLSNTIDTLKFVGQNPSIIINGTIAEIELGSRASGEISGTQLINGTVGPTKLDRPYVEKNGDTMSGSLTISSTVASTTKTSGALVVAGGVGISGDLNVGGDIAAYATSDMRLKTNISVLTDALSKIDKISGVSYSWNSLSGKNQNKKEIGVIAQEILEVLPEAVIQRDNGYYAVDYEKIIPLLIQAIKELKEKIS